MISVGILLTPGVCCSKVEQPGSNNVGEIMTGLELFGKKNLQKKMPIEATLKVFSANAAGREEV